MNPGSGHEELSFTDEENETHRGHVIRPSNKGFRTHHLVVPTIESQHPHISSGSDFMQSCQFGTIGWVGKDEVVLESVQDDNVCLVWQHYTSLCT